MNDDNLRMALDVAQAITQQIDGGAASGSVSWAPGYGVVAAEGAGMNDERQATYQRLIADLDYLVSVSFGKAIWIKREDVIDLLAEEFLVERRGVPAVGSSSDENGAHE